jgi:IPT/TIG domain/FG-GAP repeat
MTDRMALLARASLPWRLALSAALLAPVPGLLLARALAGHTLAGPSFSLTPASTHASSSAPGAQLASLPSSARGPVSEALGAGDRRYRVSVVAGVGLQALNPAQRLRVDFKPDAVLLSAGATRLGLRLRAVGFGSKLAGTAAARAPRAHANRVIYARGGLSEWYANGPLGLEQGFTIAHAPAGAQDGPLTLALAFSGNARAAIARGANGIVFTGPGGAALRYGGLVASDARGRTLHSWLELRGRQVLLRVDAHGASYPLRIDPLVANPEHEELPRAKEEEGEGLFGYSVALSQDGSTALVGAPKGSGGASVFVHVGSTWQLQQRLIGEATEGEGSERCPEEVDEEEQGCGFGRSVALSANGNTALVGAPRADNGVGQMQVFTRTGSTWKSTAILESPAGEVRSHFGKSVALSADGTTAVVGAPAGRDGSGAAWVFTRASEEEGAGWSKGEPLADGRESSQGHFGLSVALSPNGDTVLIGGPNTAGVTFNQQQGQDLEADNAGAAWVFTRSASDLPFAQPGQKLTVTGAGEGERELGEGRFGFSVALSGDGTTALVGARTDDEGQGAAWVFTRSGSQAWTQGAKLTSPERESGYPEFGYSVALSDDGETALIGSPKSGHASGSAWVFANSGSAWSEREALLAGESEAGMGQFGENVALSGDAEQALVGGPIEKGSTGAAWPFEQGQPVKANELSPVVTGVAPQEGPAAGGTKVTIEGSRLSGANAVHFGSTPAASFSVKPSGAIVAVSPAGEAGATVAVTVTTPDGTSGGSNDNFTFKAAKTGGGGTGHSGGESNNPSSSSSSSSPLTGAVLGFGPAPSASCAVALHSRGVAVAARSRAIVKLGSLGVAFSGVCKGKLEILVKVKLKTKKGHKQRFGARNVGSASFSVLAGKSVAVTVKLNRAGRKLLGAHHGRLSAKLVILQAIPGPPSTHSAIVHLALQTGAKAKPKTGK